MDDLSVSTDGYLRCPSYRSGASNVRGAGLGEGQAGYDIWRLLCIDGHCLATSCDFGETID